MRSFSQILFVGTLFLVGALECVAQQRDDAFEFTYLLNWPAELRTADAAEETRFGYDLLAFIDTLSLGYAYGVDEDRPTLRFSLAWTPGAFGVFDNEKVPYDDLPSDVRIVAVDLVADVYVDDGPVAGLTLRLDSLTLAPVPDAFFFEKADTTWDGVFDGVSEADARSYFAGGFALRGLRIDRIAFAAYGPADDEDDFEPVFDPRYPTGVGVYPPDIGIFVDWVIWPGNRSAGKRGAGDVRSPRKPREGIGRGVPAGDPGRPRTRTGDRSEPDDEPAGERTTRTRTGDRDDVAAGRDAGRGKTRPGKTGKTKDDDDDDAELLPAALAGVAAVGLLAVAAGTIGYYGNSEAPIGLTSGYVQPKGGLLLQVAVNSAVLGGDGPEKLLGKVTGFYGITRGPVQPAVGLGLFAEEGGDDVDLTPSLSLGAVGNFGQVILLGGYDLTAKGIDFGIAYNFRGRRGR